MVQQPSWIGYTLSGRYKISSLLGSGGMAAVYQAQDLNLGRFVAIKLIHPHLAQQPEFVQRFKREAAAVAKLRHPNVVPVYDFSHEQGVYYMVLAYIDGGHLGERLKALKEAEMRFPLAQTIRIMSTLCDAVAYAHEQKIIHRDIKPSNVLFDKKEQSYLADFGIARMAEGQQTMTIVGTPTYMSPEQARGDQTLDQRSDIYSLGVVLYEMASGQPPFEGSMTTLMWKHMHEPIPDIRLLNRDIPVALVAIIEKALAKNPDDRFLSATEMAAALRTPHSPRSDSPPGTPPPPKPIAQQRPRWLWAIGLLVVVVAIVGVVFSGILSPEPEPPSTVTTSSEEVATEVVDNESAAISAPEPANEAEVADVTTASCPDSMVLSSDGKFCLDIQEVTNAAYKKCVDAGACDPPQNTTTLVHGEYYANPQFDDYPVVWVNWNQANTYCQFAEKRLPTASEWEQAAQTLDWPSEEEITSPEDTQAVQSSAQDVTPERIYDLAGNVSEWVDESDGSRKVIKGNRFNSSSSHNERVLPATADRAIGFRCATNIP